MPVRLNSLISLLINETKANLEMILGGERLAPEELCVVDPISLPAIYESRAFISGYLPNVTQEDIQQLKSYISTRLVNLDGVSEKVPEITAESVAGFLSSTSNYLFDKAGEVCSGAGEILTNALKARADKKISPAVYETMVNVTIDGVFKAAVSGVMSGGSLEESLGVAINETISRAQFGVGGVAISNLLEHTIDVDKKDLKMPIRAAAKTLAKGGSFLGGGISAVSAAITSDLPKYTKEVLTHGVIGGAIGYAKTGNIAESAVQAVRSAAARGIYYGAWECHDGKAQLNQMNFLNAGIARISSKLAAEMVMDRFPMAGVAAVAGVAIAENLYAYMQSSKNPLIASALENIQNSLPDLRSAAKDIFEGTYEFGQVLNKSMAEMYGYQEKEGPLSKRPVSQSKGR